MELGSNGGDVHVCMPYTMIEPIRDLLTSAIQGEALEVDKRWVRLLSQQVQTAEVEVVAHLANANVHVSDILNMKVGDVVRSSWTTASPPGWTACPSWNARTAPSTANTRCASTAC